MFGDFPAHLTHSRLPPAERNQSAYPLVTFLAWGLICATLLLAKDGDLAAWPFPLSPPWYPGGPRAEGLAIAAWDWSGCDETYKKHKTEKHLWLDSL